MYKPVQVSFLSDLFCLLFSFFSAFCLNYSVAYLDMVCYFDSLCFSPPLVTNSVSFLAEYINPFKATRVNCKQAKDMLLSSISD